LTRERRQVANFARTSIAEIPHAKTSVNHDPAAARGREIKAARALIGMSASGLAHAAGLQNWHIHYCEAGRPRGGRQSLAMIRRALESEGIRFADNGLGVRLEPGRGRS
jgi:hypothetical protein